MPYKANEVRRRLCRVADRHHLEGLRLIRASRGGCNACRFAPSVEGAVACGTVLVGGQTIAVELEMVVDPAVSGQETLGMEG